MHWMLGFPTEENSNSHQVATLMMAKKSRGGRMAAAKRRAAKMPGGTGKISKRAAGRKMMKT